MGPGVDIDTRTSSFNKGCLPLFPPKPPKPKNAYCSGAPSLAISHMKHSRVEQKDRAGTAEKKSKSYATTFGLPREVSQQPAQPFLKNYRSMGCQQAC